MNSTAAFFGGLIGLVGFGVLAFVLGAGWALFGIAAGIVLVLYILAAATAQGGFSEIVRGVLIGGNSALNGLFGVWIATGLFKSQPVGIVIGVVLALFNFLLVFQAISNSQVYEGFLGWLNWLMPMSWVVAGLGLAFFVLNLVGGIIGALGATFFKLTGMDADWKTGTFFTKGGWISNLNPIDTAFNMGNFAFVDSAYSSMAKEHEAGHTLNLGAFGSVFHVIGAIDENVLRRGADAYAEKLAESNDPSASPSVTIPMWA